MYEGGAALSIAWKISPEEILFTDVGPGFSEVELGDNGLVAVEAPGPRIGSLVKPPEGSPVIKLCDVLVNQSW